MLKKMLSPCLVVFLILILMAGGCSSASPTSTTTATTAANTSATSTSKTTTSTSPSTTSKVPTITSSLSTINQTTPVPKGPVYGGTLRIIQNSDLASFLPWEAMGGADFAQRIPAIETLVRIDEKGNVVPFLAESFILNSAEKTIVFKLRQGVKFHDGTNFDAKACKWNFEQLKASSLYGGDFIRVSGFEVADDYILRIRFSTWDALFINNMILDSAMISPTAFEKNGADWARVNAVGTGPFKLVTFTRDVEKIFEKFPDYWQKGKPYLDKVEINIIADATVSVASFLRNENDILTNVIPSDAVTLKTKPGVVLTQAQVVAWYSGLFGNMVTSGTPFANLKVRQAMSYAIDRQSICDYIYKGYASVSYQTGTAANWYYNPNVKGYPYDPKKAKALLTEAGYPNGFNTVINFQSNKLYKDVFTAVQSNLADIGIKADLQVADGGSYWDMLGGKGWENGLLAATMQVTTAYMDPQYNYWSKSPQGGIPQCILHTPELDSLIEQMSEAPNHEVEKELAWKIQAMVTDELCLISVIDVAGPLAAKSSKVHDEYTSTIAASPYTYADAWMEK